MAEKWVELVTGSLEQKMQDRQYVARIDALLEPYAGVLEALQRSLVYFGGVTDGETVVKMFGDFTDAWEQRAAADRTPIRAIVGDERVEFGQRVADGWGGKQWIDKGRAQLTGAIEGAERKVRS
nr:DUF1048 domain-containing protein [Pedococcus sp. 5OH_020]